MDTLQQQRFTNNFGTLYKYGGVWLLQGGIDNIIFLERFRGRYPITLQEWRFTI